MDPALWGLYESGSDEDEVSVILRLTDEAKLPDNVRAISRFGKIVTARVRRGQIPEVWDSDEVVSVKAARSLSWPLPVGVPDDPTEEEPEAPGAPRPSAPSHPAVPEDGTGVIVGVCDWGFDFTHPNFRNPDGSTRLLALWDQAADGGPAPEPFGYGRVHTPEAINAALAAPDPLAALDYYPSGRIAGNVPSHGTHVTDILAGNRREPGSEVGLASGARIVFVHLGAERLRGLANLGDSVRLLEGIDFIRRQAGARPCVIHLSMGMTGSAHRGETPFEQAIDAMVLSRPNLALVQSVGNYADSAMHTHGRIGPDQSAVLVWVISRGDRTPNELEIWYSGQDVFDATLTAPNGAEFPVRLGGRAKLVHGGADWGTFHHRAQEPNSGLNHIDIFLLPSGPPGRWRVALRGLEVVDGRFHAWIERDGRGRSQSRFVRSQATSRYTTNTICNSFRAIAVGAYDGTRSDRPAAPFSSRGPSADGRQKPELVAPGYRILAARSVPTGGWSGERRLTVKSGTSMAAPWVSGTVALMYQAAGRPLTIHEVRSLLIGTADPYPGRPGRCSTRLGYGYLNVEAAVNAARRLAADRPAEQPQPVAPAIAPLREDAGEGHPADSIEARIEDDDHPELDDQEQDFDEGGVDEGEGEDEDEDEPEAVSLDELHEILTELV